MRIPEGMNTITLKTKATERLNLSLGGRETKMTCEYEIYVVTEIALLSTRSSTAHYIDQNVTKRQNKMS